MIDKSTTLIITNKYYIKRVDMLNSERLQKISDECSNLPKITKE